MSAMTRNDQRRCIAESLRALDVFDIADGEFYDRGEVEDVLGLVTDDGAWYETAGVRRLADLISLDVAELTVRDNLALIERNRQLECELARLKSQIGGAHAAFCDFVCECVEGPDLHTNAYVDGVVAASRVIAEIIDKAVEL